jgi:hypothetical protein
MKNETITLESSKFRGRLSLYRFWRANVSKREFAGWFKAFFSMAFYVGLFSGIGYLIQITLF